MTDRVDEARALLARLKEKLVAGEIDRAEFSAQRELIVADLEPEEQARLGGVTATPRPAATGRPAGAPPLGPSDPQPSPFGPSGGRGGGQRTALPQLSNLAFEPGTTILGQWKIVRELGRGGFGAVFEAEELRLGERHAVKILDPAMVADQDLLARFRREVKLMRKLTHPRIVRVYEYREEPGEGLALISMELVEGGSLADLRTVAQRSGAPIPVALTTRLLRQILEALVEAHRENVMHRDVTPGNVLLAGGTPAEILADLDRDPRVKLVDFGIAGAVERSELSQKSRVLGTAAYVAPEVLEVDGRVTTAADLYGAGAVAYELFTGHLPLGRYESPRELRGELPEELDALVLALLSRNADSRPTAAAALLRLDGEGATATTGTHEPEPTQRPALEGGAARSVRAPLTPPADSTPAPGTTHADARGGQDAAPGGGRRTVGLAGGLAVVVVAAGLGWWTFQGDGAADRSATPAAGTQSPTSPDASTSGQRAAPSGATGSEAGVPAQAPRVDPAEEARLREQTRLQEERDRAAAAERAARERVSRYVDRSMISSGAPAAVAVDRSGRVLDAVTQRLNDGLGGSSGLFRPSFASEGLVRRAAEGDRGALEEVGLASYGAALLLVQEELDLASDRLARDLTAATVTLRGRLYRAGGVAVVTGTGKKGDFNRDRAIERARADAADDLLEAVARAQPR